MIRKSTTAATHQEVDPTYERLAESLLYQTYKKAFADATGLNLKLLPVDSNTQTATQEQSYSTTFCQAINENGPNCEQCILAQKCLRKDPVDYANTITCFAKMKETAIPIKSGENVIAFLTTGQIFTDDEPANDETFAQILQKLSDSELPAEQLKNLWQQTPRFSNEKYQGAITLLAAFGLQLSELLNRILLENANTEPDVITKAKRYINAHLEDKIELETVAEYSGVSSYYFCKLFKQHTKMTLTEYVNRRRVEWAKQRLKDPNNRITEIAYDVGYQSLSQFNRSFAKYAGMSPTQFRNRLSTNKTEKSDRLAA